MHVIISGKSINVSLWNGWTHVCEKRKLEETMLSGGHANLGELCKKKTKPANTLLKSTMCASAGLPGIMA